MFNWRNFPWTDFQDLNLDWIMKKIKEIKTEDLPQLDEKIDNVYDYIRENLPDIIQQLASVIIDVTIAGAKGDGVTDDSEAIKNALNMGNILYFPSGKYLFKNVPVNKPVIIFGDGDSSIFTPIRRHPTTNQFHNMFTFYDDVTMSNIKLLGDTSVTEQTGTMYLNEAAFIAEMSDHVHVEHVTIDNIIETYRTSVGSLDFEDRHGMAIYFHNCGEVCLTDCDILNFAGEELMWISQDKSRYALGIVNISKCRFHDKTTTYNQGGSAINTLGGNLTFAENQIYNYSCIRDDQSAGFSIFNFMSAWVNVSDNIFHDCRVGNYIDISEGYYNKVERVILSNNIFDGDAHSPIRFMAKSVLIKGNYIRSALGILTLMCNSTPTTGVPYCVNADTLYEYEDFDFCDNVCIVTAPPYALTLSSMSHFIGLGQTQDVDNKPTLKRLNISNNTFVYNPDAVAYGMIYTNSNVDEASYNNNIFYGSGPSYPSANVFGVRANGLFSSSAAVHAVAAYNIFHKYNSNTATVVFLGTTTSRPLMDIETVFNRGIGTITYNNTEYPAFREHMAIGSAPFKSTFMEYNSNITDVANT